jgi:hypothetical protein
MLTYSVSGYRRGPNGAHALYSDIGYSWRKSIVTKREKAAEAVVNKVTMVTTPAHLSELFKRPVADSCPKQTLMCHDY